MTSTLTQQLMLLMGIEAMFSTPEKRGYLPTVQDREQAKALTKKQMIREEIRARRKQIKGGV